MCVYVCVPVHGEPTRACVSSPPPPPSIHAIPRSTRGSQASFSEPQVQGSLMVAALFEVFLGVTGAVGALLRFIGE